MNAPEEQTPQMNYEQCLYLCAYTVASTPDHRALDNINEFCHNICQQYLPPPPPRCLRGQTFRR
jgi:hypothetical protein